MADPAFPVHIVNQTIHTLVTYPTSLPVHLVDNEAGTRWSEAWWTEHGADFWVAIGTMFLGFATLFAVAVPIVIEVLKTRDERTGIRLGLKELMAYLGIRLTELHNTPAMVLDSELDELQLILRKRTDALSVQIRLPKKEYEQLALLTAKFTNFLANRRELKRLITTGLKVSDMADIQTQAYSKAEYDKDIAEKINQFIPIYNVLAESLAIEPIKSNITISVKKTSKDKV